MPFEQARTLLCEGEALRRSRHPAAARLPLRHALTIFNRLGARPWAARAMIELDATGARAHARNETSTSVLDSLSSQELQVSRAVGRGLNNVEAAAALFVSHKTVEAHLTRVYRKLGIRSRNRTHPPDGHLGPSALDPLLAATITCRGIPSSRAELTPM